MNHFQTNDGGDGNCRCCDTALSDTVLATANVAIVIYRVTYDIGCAASPRSANAVCTDAVHRATGYSCACDAGYTGSATSCDDGCDANYAVTSNACVQLIHQLLHSMTGLF